MWRLSLMWLLLLRRQSHVLHWGWRCIRWRIWGRRWGRTLEHLFRINFRLHRRCCSGSRSHRWHCRWSWRYGWISIDLTCSYRHWSKSFYSFRFGRGDRPEYWHRNVIYWSKSHHWTCTLRKMRKSTSWKKDENDKPCFTAPTLFRGILTPSLMGIPWPSALGRRECDRRTGVDGAGDWERGEGAVDDDWGGPFAQADFARSEVGFFGGAVAVDDLLILQRDIWETEEKKRKEKKCTICYKTALFRRTLDDMNKRRSYKPCAANFVPIIQSSNMR